MNCGRVLLLHVVILPSPRKTNLQIIRFVAPGRDKTCPTMNFEKVWLEKVLCVLLQAGAVPEQSSAEKENEGKGASEVENRVGRFWKRRKDVRK